MTRQNRSNIGLGLLLILVGGWFLAQQLYPQLRIWEYFNFSWPWYIIGTGLGLLLLALALGSYWLAVPAMIVGGIGGILYWQNETDNWSSWSYAWALIPGFVGLGILLAEFLSGNFRNGLRNAGPLILISLILFVIFSAFLGNLSFLTAYWPVLLILLGAWLLIQPLLKRKPNKV